MEKYEWIGPKDWKVFMKGGKAYNLETITDKRIEKLLKEDEKYWSEKFRLKKTSNAKEAKSSAANQKS